VGLEKVRRWVERGLFGRAPYRPEMRVPETGVLDFLRTRHSEYDLTRVHQQWFKALLFGERMEGGLTMAFDSAADLLFRIGANTDDAEANVARFRQLLSTDLKSIGTQFSDWADKVFGSMDTVSGALLGVTAGLAPAFAVHAADHFQEYTLEVDNAAKKTGTSVETMSTLRFTADEMGSTSTGWCRASRSSNVHLQGGPGVAAADGGIPAAGPFAERHRGRRAELDAAAGEVADLLRMRRHFLHYRPHSYRRATTGSTLVALRAGT
jgi:hypothetical protein